MGQSPLCACIVFYIALTYVLHLQGKTAREITRTVSLALPLLNTSESGCHTIKCWRTSRFPNIWSAFQHYDTSESCVPDGGRERQGPEESDAGDEHAFSCTNDGLITIDVLRCERHHLTMQPPLRYENLKFEEAFCACIFPSNKRI